MKHNLFLIRVFTFLKGVKQVNHFVKFNFFFECQFLSQLLLWKSNIEGTLNFSVNMTAPCGPKDSVLSPSAKTLHCISYISDFITFIRVNLN